MSDPEIPPGGRYKHPVGWFECAVPPGWVVDPGSDPVRIVGPDAEAVAVISIAKTQGVPLPRARSHFLRRAIKGMVVVRRLAESEGERDGLTWARSEELLGHRLPWYKRLFRRPEPVTRFISVCYTRGPLLALLTVEVDPAHVERHRLMIDAMAGSLRLAEAPARTPDEFVTGFLAEATRRFPERAFDRSEHPLTVQIDGAELSLEQPYRAHVCDSSKRAQVFESVFRYLSANPIPAPGSEPFDAVRERILPTIKPRAWVTSTDEKLPDPHKLLWMPFPNDTAVVFVVDYDAAMRFVSRDESERWETPPKLMLEIARDNLARRAEEPRQHLLVTKEGEPHAVAVAEGDGYDAARLLLPGLRLQLAEHFGEAFAVAIPNRDYLIAFRTDKRGVVHRMRKLIERDSSRRPYPITHALFHFTERGIEAFEE